MADGDLTVRATVTEDVTGAIADSLNYTTEEFRKLVSRIIAAVEQMGHATKDAEDISKGLLDAAQKQAKEIQTAGEAVQLITQSIKEVDSSAAQSASVARRTLVATEQGAQAVRNTISGMDAIREQIQDTSKRIKRLGESSQEIGEIVDLISDITEQTNVLALNAAIQAASAGEAGRGFSVVAEEVQRLAERSGEATKQIGALVKTIQGDTHDAVAAMEKSTLGVVEGAKLSDMAGQSLREIEQVSNELAALINSISTSTQVQTDMASEVASVMQDILQITVQTTEGTRLTADSIAQLTGLTADLRGSVAGFKL
jgi:twitching motility protein PilJ